jgi:AraC family cel operon transcriptional repressor
MAFTLRLGQLNRPGQVVSVYRSFYAPGHRFPMHSHDFPEIFYIESGRGEQLMGSGQRMALGAGDLGLIDAEAEHELAADPDAAMVLINIAFSRRFLASLRDLAPRGAWPWLPRQAPVRPLDEPLQGFLEQWIETLSGARAGRTDLAVFLLDLMRRLAARPATAAAVPPWLDDVVAHLDRPEILAGGVRALAALAGRSPDNLGRSIRRTFGCSTVALVNRHRMAWFARELRLGTRPIVALAAECGLPNLSHCYRLFRAAHGCSPRRYRQRYQGGVVAAGA